MKLRYALITVFSLLAFAPLALLSAWPQSSIFKNELEEVHERHLLIAQNLAAALNRYHRDLTTTFELLLNDPAKWQDQTGMEPVLANLSFRNICLVDKTTGAVVGSLEYNGIECPASVSQERLAFFLSLAQPNQTTFSGVMASPDGTNVILLVRSVADNLAVGSIGTDYFQELGSAISFGVKGHAAIVDHLGRALSHPLPSWVESRKDMSKISAVERMMRGETGVEQFYSPALKGDMIAGLTSVEPVGWGVMIPQPVAELEAKAANALWSIIFVLVIVTTIALALAVWVSFVLARPLEWISAQTQSVADGNVIALPAPKQEKFLPVEFRSVQRNVSAMVQRLGDNLAKINKLAYYDSVTGLANRSRLISRLQSLTDVGNNKQQAILLFIDLDDFKSVNDNFGHEAGDEALKAVAKVLSDIACIDKSKTPSDRFEPEQDTPLLARLGGDEFALFLPGNTAAEGIRVGEDIITALSDLITLSRAEVRLGASVGVAVFPDHGEDGKALLRAADLAMYASKALGKGRMTAFCPELLSVQIARTKLGQELEVALEEGQLHPYFQPQISAKDLTVVGVEALVRWHHPERGVLEPDQFLKAASELGFAREIDRIILNRAVAGILDLRAKEIFIPKLSVNVSAISLKNDEIVNDVDMCGLLPFDLSFELLETIFLDELDPTKAGVISKLVERGVTIELDDFGTGHSSIVALRKLNSKRLKIDRGLVSDITSSDKQSLALVDAILQMGKILDIGIVAEGVETRDQVDLLRALGCDTLQGFYFAKPMPLETLARYCSQAERA